jgi:hypothetical protein
MRGLGGAIQQVESARTGKVARLNRELAASNSLHNLLQGLVGLGSAMKPGKDCVLPGFAVCA